MGPKKNEARGVARVRLSRDAENKLSKLVENVGLGKSMQVASSGFVDRKQTEKRLKKIYDSLANEGFTNEQIELALAAIPLASISLEAALDWLCLNLHSNDLPLKFTSGYAVDDKVGSVQVLASSQASTAISKDAGERKDEFVDLVKLEDKSARKAEQRTDKDWIRQYVAQQEEDESESQESDLSDWEDRVDKRRDFPLHLKGLEPAEQAKKIAEALLSAKKDALEAKQRGDKQHQSEAGNLIKNLKEKMAKLGLNEQDVLATALEDRPEKEPSPSENEQHLVKGDDETESSIEQDEEDLVVEISKENNENLGASSVVVAPEEDEELMGMFDEESAHEQSLPESVVNMQKKKEIKPWGAKSGGWLKSNRKDNKMKANEELRKSPRAVLQQRCLKNGWNAPTYEKLSGKFQSYDYSVTVLRQGAGRGKRKTAGGPVTYSFPEQGKAFTSISEAQDAVATWALFSLFPEDSVFLELLEPYQSMWFDWQQQGKTANDSDTRDAFISSLIISGQTPAVYAAPEHVEKLLDVPATHVFVRTSRKTSRQQDEHDLSAINSHLKLRQAEKMQDRKYMTMLSAREKLPIASVKESILEHLTESNVLVVSGETGSGKTTQVPQYILDNMIARGQGGSCRIICTQPRRIAAISVAERVVTERCEPGPGDAGSLVGYQVRLDASWSAETRLLFCTTGILLRRLASDRDLSDISHVVVDEVHERTILGDFLISLLRDILVRRNEEGSNPLTVILMSATLDAERFSEYFGGCPVVVAQGRTYPVTTFYMEDIYERLEYRLSSDNSAAVQTRSSHRKVQPNPFVCLPLQRDSHRLIDKNRGRQSLAFMGWGDEQILEENEINPMYDETLYRSYSENTRKNMAKVNEDVIDYELLEDLIIHINKTAEPGALLVFLPGMPEILQLLDRLLVLKDFSGPAADWILPLHSSIAPADQRKVFQVPPDDIRKIILATNIAETSVTIEDVVHVIDCGKHKENRFDPRRRMVRMTEAWISQANAKQRRGRAGRVKPGNCYCLYTLHRFSTLMRPFQLPEMLRVPLVELCLQIKLLSTENVASFLQKTLDPPRSEAVESAISILREVGALTEDESITPLGYHLAALPVDVHIGKMMLYGVLLGCLSPVLTIAAYLSHKSPFVVPIGQRDAAERAKHSFSEPMDGSSTGTVAFKQQSDHLVIVAAYNNWRRIVSQGGARTAKQFCDANFLSVPVLNMLREMRGQLAGLLRDIGFVTRDQYADADRWLDDVNRPFNKNAESAAVIKAVLCAGLYPNLAAMQEESLDAGHANALNQRAGLASQKKVRWTDGRREVFIHPSSISSKVKEFQHPYLVFHEKVETTKVFLRDTTVLSPISLLLFGGTIKVLHQFGYVTVDDWIKMRVPAKVAVQVKEVRASLDALLRELTESPQGLASSRAKEVVTSILDLLIEIEHRS